MRTLATWQRGKPRACGASFDVYVISLAQFLQDPMKISPETLRQLAVNGHGEVDADLEI